MRREEKRKKFNEAIISTLYPPPPSPPSESEEDKPVSVSREGFDAAILQGDSENTDSSASGNNDEDIESEIRKLTRAQRKRHRKKKLREDSSRRKQIIGPLLPPIEDASSDVGVTVDETLSVRDEQPNIITTLNKSKQRRMAKKLAKKRLRSNDRDNCEQDQTLKSSDPMARDDQIS